jgi:hypothetical protein
MAVAQQEMPDVAATEPDESRSTAAVFLLGKGQALPNIRGMTEEPRRPSHSSREIRMRCLAPKWPGGFQARQ